MDKIIEAKSLLDDYGKIFTDHSIISNTNISDDLKDLVSEELQEKCVTIKSALESLIASLPEIIFTSDEKQVVLSNSDRKQVMTKERNTCLDIPKYIESIEDPDKKSWRRDLSLKLHFIYDRCIKYNMSKEILTEIYEKMRNVYGIVWEQDYKEWKRSNEGIPRTLEIIYYNEQYKSIFDSLICDRCEEVRSLPPLTIGELARPLIEKMDDKSKGGGITIKKIYLHMEDVHNVKWSRMAAKYEKEKGCRTSSKSDLLLWNHGLLERFRRSIHEMLEELE